jgi:hypothetical protein
MGEGAAQHQDEQRFTNGQGFGTSRLGYARAIRPVVFHRNARSTIRAFLRDVRDRLGQALSLFLAGETDTRV